MKCSDSTEITLRVDIIKCVRINETVRYICVRTLCTVSSTVDSLLTLWRELGAYDCHGLSPHPVYSLGRRHRQLVGHI